MTEILRFLFGTLTDPLGLPLDWWKEWAILFAIGEIAYHFAYGFVGKLYDFDIIHTRTGGKIAHWTIRLVCYVVMWAVIRVAIWLFRWIASNWITALCIVAGIVAIAILITVIKRKRTQKL